MKTVTETLGDFVRYGYVALPLWVFTEQLGVRYRLRQSCWRRAP
jgi:hypothetical protein